MKILLHDGCDPNIVDNSGETLLIDAIKRNKLQSIKLLLDQDCRANIKNKQGVSPLGQAIMSMNN
jgi:ankyrin repeat protein